MFPTIQIGPLALQAPGLILLGGLWLGLSLAEKLAMPNREAVNHLYNLTFTALIAGIIGARLAYLLRFPDAFMANPLSLLSLNPGLLDRNAGLAVGLLAAVVYGQRKNLNFWFTLDRLTPLFAVFMVAISLSNFASGSAFGAPTDLPWGIELWGATRHPTQIYAALLAAGILVLVVRWQATKSTAGMVFLQFVAWSAAAMLLVEGFRGDSLLVGAGLRLAQLVAWGLLALSLWGLWSLGRTDRDRISPSYPTERV